MNIGAGGIMQWVLLAGMVVGGFGYIYETLVGMEKEDSVGKQFQEGFMAMGTLAFAMIGLICLAPVLGKMLSFVVMPLSQVFGSDPSVFAGMFLANDMGGYHLAEALMKNDDAGLFSGLIVGSMMGPTIVFTVPVALAIIKREHARVFALGILSGIITIPIGCLVGGIVAGFDFNIVIANLAPVLFVSLFISWMLWVFPNSIIRSFLLLSRCIKVVLAVGLILAALEVVSGTVIIPGMNSYREGVRIVSEIAIFLAGAFSLVWLIARLLTKPLSHVGELLGVNTATVIGMIAALANNIPSFHQFKNMGDRGRLFCAAFSVSASFALGDHLAFTAGVGHSELIMAVIIGKLVGGITALFVAQCVAEKML